MKKIRVKIIARGSDSRSWSRQLPKSHPLLDRVEFIWSAKDPNYDWLVVIDDISRTLKAAPELLGCADEHTLLVTTEPDSITNYGTAFCAQFEHVLTSQPPQALDHPKRIYSHTGNFWFNDHTFEELNCPAFPEKTKTFSTVCSTKQQKYTLHKNRHDFSHWLKSQIPEIEIYGHGARHIEHKFEALDPFRFHLAIENYVGPHHWTEKLADPFLSGAFPIYYGCTNLEDYFPADSFLEIDIFKPEESLAKIRSIIEDDRFYTSRIDSLREARHRVLHDYNLLFMIGKLVDQNYQSSNSPSGRPVYGRKQMRLQKPSDGLNHITWSLKRHLRRSR
ncbi:MAG: glycosyltransferase family 10 domain-containing protein [Opitutaceae bacterium]